MIKFYEIEFLRYTYLKSDGSNQITKNSFHEDLLKILNIEENTIQQMYDENPMNLFEIN